MATTKPKPKVEDKDIPTRAKAEQAIAQGADPQLYITHRNKHVRAKAQKKIDALSAVIQTAVDNNLAHE